MVAKKKPEVAEAVRLVIEEGLPPYEAVKVTGANQFSVYSALRKMKSRLYVEQAPICPCCGRALKPGEVVTVPVPAAEAAPAADEQDTSLPPELAVAFGKVVTIWNKAGAGSAPRTNLLRTLNSIR